MTTFREMTLALGAGAALFAASQLQAQTLRHCAPRAAVVERLAQSYGETRQSIGLGGNNAVVEVFASQATGSWTITVTMADGTTCLLASGQAFETMAEPLPASGEEA